MTSVPALSTHGVSWSLSAVTRGGTPNLLAATVLTMHHRAAPMQDTSLIIWDLNSWVGFIPAPVFFWCPTPAEKHQNLFSNI